MMNTMQQVSRRLTATSGFTLVETMVAVAIITIAIAGPMVTASRAALAANLSRDQLTASYLAQEGIEYVRMLRDEAYLTELNAGAKDPTSAAWIDFVIGNKNPTFPSISTCRNTGCTFDPGKGVGYSLVPCNAGACTPLYLANGIYTQQSDIAGATKTPFTRTVQAVDISTSDERIVSKVSWMYHGQTYNVTIMDHLTPWQ